MTSKVVTKAVTVTHINESIGLSKRESKVFFESMLDLIVESLKKKKLKFYILRKIIKIHYIKVILISF